MAFPAGPTDGQTHTEGADTWIYRAAAVAWERQAGAAGGAQSYVHTQAAAANPWVVTHGLGFEPSGILVQDAAGTDVTPDNVTHVNSSQLTIAFYSPQAGTATVS